MESNAVSDTDDQQQVEASSLVNQRSSSVPPHLVQRMEELKARKQHLCSRSTNARKLNLKKQIYEKVVANFSPSDRAMIDADPDLELQTIATEQATRLRWRKKKTEKEHAKDSTSVDNISYGAELAALAPVVPKEERNVNYPTQEGPLERAFDNAVSQGHVELATRLSDRLIANKVALEKRKAVAAKRELDRKQEIDKNRSGKRRKKHQWTFCSKERWESKCNM